MDPRCAPTHSRRYRASHSRRVLSPSFSYRPKIVELNSPHCYALPSAYARPSSRRIPMHLKRGDRLRIHTHISHSQSDRVRPTSARVSSFQQNFHNLFQLLSTFDIYDYATVSIVSSSSRATRALDIKFYRTKR